MKSILTLCAFLILFNLKGLSQENINAYKYVIVPTSYNFLNEPDQYQTNSLTKFLFEKHGFTTLLADEEFPEDLNNNRCLGLYADVEKHKAFLNTKLQVHLKDCNNKVVLSSEIGESREKEYAKVYNLALRDAFKSFDNINYSYQPSAKIVAKTTTSPSQNADDLQVQEEIERLKKEVEALREMRLQKEADDAKAIADKQNSVVDQEKIDLDVKEEKPVKKEAKIELAETLKKENKSDESIQTLFANPVANGYTITDASSKVLYHLVFSGKEDVYIVKGQDAIVYKMNNSWIVSKANDSGVSMKTLNVKFN
ncbi:Eisosome component PIL1/LSP1 family protein [Gelidibacter japonicus]|uniref:Eisosome component PIL1/LSP1 family protein n=1 Tax=Gelidibacter japonicus TaxID=1962232 RepID=UPI0020226FC4|nr:Eisosome component PIL1/LSP1 family protein [Gelidibacter japonicus]MCL8008456.1 Eisosome component PIL1/LSP1 family protein [Gelidibacter japonicus]